MSPSVTPKSPVGRHSFWRSVSPERDHGKHQRRGRSPVGSSPRSRSPPIRERSPAHHKSSHRNRGGSPMKERHSSRSPSPRTKRLRRAQAERDSEKGSNREHDRNHGKGSEKNHEERDSAREAHKDRRDRKYERERERERERESEKSRDHRDAKSSRSRHPRSESPSDHHHHRRRQHSRSPSRARHEDEETRGAVHGDDASDSLAKMEATEQALETKEKQKPSFELSGKLAAETNRVRGVTLLFTEPPDARKPNIRWRLYVFKGGEVLNEPLYVHRQSCYLFGRERRVADIPTDHPSCSKQHAVLQFRQVEKELPDGMTSKEVRPYLMDLGSTNKTFINENAIDPQRYYELFEKDTLRFGNSSREYVLLHENSIS